MGRKYKKCHLFSLERSVFGRSNFIKLFQTLRKLLILILKWDNLGRTLRKYKNNEPHLKIAGPDFKRKHKHVLTEASVQRLVRFLSRLRNPSCAIYTLMQ